MGLDGVELILECEDRFDISISDAEAASLFTVGDLHALILTKLSKAEPTGGCATRAAFHRLRQGFLTCGIGRENVKVDTQLNDLIPPPQRTVVWSQLACAMNLRLPRLVRPKQIQFAILGSLAGTALVARLFWTSSTLLAVLIGIGPAILVHMVTFGIRTALPPNCTTVRELATQIASLNWRATCEASGLQEKEVWRILQVIISEQFGIREEEVTPEQRFVEDLGVG